MLNKMYKSYLIGALYVQMADRLVEFKSTENNIDNIIKVAMRIESLINSEEIKYRDLSIYGDLYNHSINVAILNGIIGNMFNLEHKFELILGGLLHDIGKLYIPLEILDKPNKLNLDEKIIASKHPDIGYEKLLNKVDNKVLNIVLNHHKKVNELKYPIEINDFKGNEDVYELVCGISDIIDAMFSYRTYKKPLTIKEVHDELLSKGIIEISSILNKIL